MALSNSQYDAIMRVYNQRQFQDKREQDKRIAEVYEKIPQVEALSDEIAATMAQATGTGAALSQPHLRAASRPHGRGIFKRAESGLLKTERIPNKLSGTPVCLPGL